MNVNPSAILGSGLVTGVGLTSPATCAAIRCNLDNFQDSKFVGRDGAWILGCEVAFEAPVHGIRKLSKMLAQSIRECLEVVPDAEIADVPMFICLAEEDRPGRIDNLNGALIDQLRIDLASDLHRDSQVFPSGKVGAAVALLNARRMLHRSQDPHDLIVVAGVDSFLVGPTLKALEEQDRILTGDNSNGFIPGEASGALLLGRPDSAKAGDLICVGQGFAKEQATIASDEPLLAKGLTQAVKSALTESGTDMSDMAYRLTDNNGEQYGFRETSLVLSKTLRVRREAFDVWHLADSIGEVGAASLPSMLAVAACAAQNGYSPGPTVLLHLGNDDGKRAALVMRQAGGLD